MTRSQNLKIVLSLVVFLASFFSYSKITKAEFIVPVDGQETYYCIWRDNQTTEIADSSGKLRKFSLARAKTDKAISDIAARIRASSGEKRKNLNSKLSQLKKIKRGIKICQQRSLGIEDGVPNLPIDSILPITASGAVSSSTQSMNCVASSYLIKKSFSESTASGFILCQIRNSLEGGFGYNFQLVRPNQSPEDIIVGMSRYSQKTTNFLDGSFCVANGQKPCANENASKFREKIVQSNLELAVNVAGFESAKGTLTCTVGCERIIGIRGEGERESSASLRSRK